MPRARARHTRASSPTEAAGGDGSNFDDIRVCTPMRLPAGLEEAAASVAVDENPLNAPSRRLLESVPSPQAISVLTDRWWGAGGAKLTVGFMEPTSQALKNKILQYANRWGEFCNVTFTEASDAIIRITFQQQGYWSYVGTDCRQIPRGRPTMCLQGWTLNIRETEWTRVVGHEFGHALGCPHEHMRRGIISRLDPEKTIALFTRTQGWSRQEVITQILTPLEEAALLGSPQADETSLMTYQLPGSITIDGKPIPGGMDFSEADRKYMAGIYPKQGGPTAPPPTMTGDIWTLVGLDKNGKEVARYSRQ